MYVVISGAGKTGFSLAKRLISEDKEVAVIEKDEEKAKYLDNNLDCLVINDSGNNLDVLKEAGIEDADFFISLTNSDEINMITCALVKSEFKKVKTIARVRNFEYSRTDIFNKPVFGIDFVINPEIEAAKSIVRTLEHGARSDVMAFEDAEMQLRDIYISKNSIFKNKKLIDIRNELPMDFLVTSILRDNFYLIPDGNTMIKENDYIYLLSTAAGFEYIFTRQGEEQNPLKNILLVGGGKVGRYVSEYILEEKSDIQKELERIKQSFPKKIKRKLHIVDKNYVKCKTLAQNYEKALVTHADISDEGFLEEENLKKYDLMINCTSNQELNIVSSIYGKKLGVPRTISFVKNSGYRNIGKLLGTDVTISMNNSVVNSILRLIRLGGVRNIFPIANSDLEVIEFSVDEGSKFIDQRIMDIKLPSENLILFVTSNGNSKIARGDMVIRKGDHIVLITKKQSVKKLEELF